MKFRVVSGLHLDLMILRIFSKLNEAVNLFCKIVHVTQNFWRSPSLASCSTQDHLGQVVYVQLSF